MEKIQNHGLTTAPSPSFSMYLCRGEQSRRRRELSTSQQKVPNRQWTYEFERRLESRVNHNGTRR